MTRLLTRTDLLELLDPAACVQALREGFAAAAQDALPGQRVRTDLPFPGTATALLPGLLPGTPAYTVKVNAKFPGASPALRGVICLHSGADGALLALLDSATVTAWRTGLAAALATDLLARPAADGAETVGVIGAGAQSELTLRGLRALRSWDRLVVHDTDPRRASAFARRHGGTVAATPAEVAAEADVVVLATWSREPLLHLADLRPGQHLTALGADEPGKRELAPEVLRSARLVVDDATLVATHGALANAGLPASAAAASLGEVIRGEAPARPHDQRLTVYTPVGLPWQDLALSWLAYQRAEAAGAGTTLDLLA
ncbi:ornithine cyclodeaminase family protein [Streptomyces sp. AC536]|uniref:ornithine cyclodeaminase family protein n=1 Tax=Streptomyces buecherae TaxID=2763006 RepID=UPI00164E8899|nr:ornithine cyclodeaminase family protein [Streptomyces buecherae]MBC3981784.1 ornithine cyclodeaminase family protein [Streptomyces buecherae]QNJ41372.1 ornithine cyclodeaminase family protein [Streptomyces buecherae]